MPVVGVMPASSDGRRQPSCSDLVSCSTGYLVRLPKTTTPRPVFGYSRIRL